MAATGKPELIAVALSGGVDSSLAAALLLEQGHRVLGLHMDLGGEAGPSLEAARTAAEHLGVELIVVDVGEVFAREVREPFLDLYQRGLTPNPCAICNREVKFKELLAAAREHGAKGLATGHYARLDHSLNPPALLRGAAKAKEQSYFLARLRPEWLGRLCFPLGSLTKEQVRKMALERGLPSARRAESQEACFLAGMDYREYYESRMPVRPGPVADRSGRIIGRHRGLYSYTVGQRRGLGIPAKKPYYVLALDGVNNTLVVGPREELFKTEAFVRAATWLVEPKDYLDREVLVQVRYRARPVAAELELEKEASVKIRFKEPQRAVAPGQLAAFYHEDRVLGGGWLA